MKRLSENIHFVHSQMYLKRRIVTKRPVPPPPLTPKPHHVACNQFEVGHAPFFYLLHGVEDILIV